MKPNLIQEPGIILLPRNAKLQADSLYFLLSESTARSLYFRNRANIEGMHVKIKQHMLPVMDVLDYLFVGKGVLLLVRTKSEEKIINYYTRIQKAKKKTVRFDKASQILSEQIRFALSSTALRTNKANGSSGCIVHSNFDRALITDVQSAERLMARMRNQQIKLCRQKKQFKANKKYWNKDKLLESKGDIYMCTKKLWDEEGKKRKMGALKNNLMADIQRVSLYVLHQLIESSLSNHNLHPIAIFPSNSS